jgi:DNA helicase-2/ATP-dependent DNA helicase PcrA
MFSAAQFFELVSTRLGKKLNPSQEQAVASGQEESLFLVAGPGSGKTTVLTLRILKLVFVDGVTPDSILATTFTRRAAAELRSRILGWGDTLKTTLAAAGTPDQKSWLKRLDLNQILTGTLDSLAEQVLRDFRGAGMQPPIVLDEFIGRALMFREGVLGTGAYGNANLKAYLEALCADDDVRTHKLGGLAGQIRQRFIHDRVDRAAFCASQPREAADLLSMIEAYESALAASQVLDFALLEEQFLIRLQRGDLFRLTERLYVVLVDEYQDTNLLQESIYFELAKSAAANDGSIAVVGDDDQSLYRFRGATVDLFRDFASRLSAGTGISAKTIYLNANYRSTPRIVDYTMAYVSHDPTYTPARVVGKPSLIAGRPTPAVDFPILAMFRPDRQILAQDLAIFIGDVVGGGRSVRMNGGSIPIRVDPLRGSIGDIALLCSSPKEYTKWHGRRTSRLPLLLRQELEPNIQVFNPRGQEFSDIACVQTACGLMLECIDPEGTVQIGMVPRKLPGDISDTLNVWRAQAATFIAGNPPAPGPAHARNTLSDFVRAWKTRTPQTGGPDWPDSVSLMSLLYNLITWIPDMQEDAEGLVYLEAITRTISQSAHFSSFKAEIRKDPPFASLSVGAAIRDIFAPLAAGEIEIDEDLLETTPRDRLNILSIHQAKGLEFPLTIVDIGSDFKANRGENRFKRHPTRGGSAHALEDALRPHSPLRRIPPRAQLDRAFDDLLRLYFVAFSRPQDVLLLVGLCDPRTGRPRVSIPNMAVGWDRRNPTPTGYRWPLVSDIVML